MKMPCPHSVLYFIFEQSEVMPLLVAITPLAFKYSSRYDGEGYGLYDKISKLEKRDEIR